jgi:hypothetical protein
VRPSQEDSLDGLAVRRSIAFLVTLVAVGAAGIRPVPASGDGGARADYDRLLECRFNAEPIALSQGGLSWNHDVGTWSLENGEVRLQEPIATGLVPGMTFVGQGSFTMKVPDRIERQQLARMSGRLVTEDFEVRFSELLLSTSGKLLSELLAQPPTGAYERSALAARRREIEFEKLRHDVAARIITGILTPDDDYLRVDMKTEEFGWLSFEYDELRREEIELSTLRQNWFNEVWVSLDRAADRDVVGRPSGERHPQIDIEHVELDVDLTGKRRSIRVGISGVNLLEVGCVATMRVVPRAGGAQALPLFLSPTAEVTAVRNENGERLEFIRDHLGGRTANLEKDVYDASLLVLLERPLRRGEPRTLTFEYMKLMANYAAGRGWYPNLPDNINDRHTARLEVMVKPKQEARATGRLVEERSGSGSRTLVWEVEDPVKAVSFSYGSDFREETVIVEGAPEVVSFGPKVSRGFGGNMIRNVGADVVNSLRFFQSLFDSKLDLERIQLTGIAAGHGQAFHGFIHMGELTYASERPGATELFRAHETAHQWWGHEIGWRSYRDQWLSEALAEYTAMMFVQATVKNGRKHFDEMLETYTEMLLGSLKGQFSKYGRPWAMRLDLAERRRMGPICLGYRAATAEIPAGYLVQTYTKGALVLHTLRSVLGSLDRERDLFVEVLREFVREHRGRDASTQDFVNVVNRVVPGEWTWFFDQWLYGTTIPTYLWDVEMAPRADALGQWQVKLRVEQQDVPDGYAMLVPVGLEYSADRSETFLAHVTQAKEIFSIVLPERPSKVVFNPDYAILARVKRR